jgi:acetyl esterase/lipase
VYLHGGYWQWGTIKASSFMAENFVKKGFIVASVGYLLAPEGNLFLEDTLQTFFS